jgi:CheY-like chemotaxis protein
MAFGVARQSGGALTIESEEGKGTAITLFLPLAATEPMREVQDDAARDTRADLTGLRIALVDDDDHVRATLADMLRTAGAEVEEARDGNSGVALVKTRRPNLLVVDFAMPGLSGAGVARRVRQEDATLPVIVVTGYAESEMLDSIAGPQVSVLRKPFESHQLLRSIADMLGR